MHIVIGGSTGFIGTPLVRSLLAAGHQITRLVRKQNPGSEIPHLKDVLWDPPQDVIELDRIEGADAVINLAGSSIARRWTNKQKREILESRVKSTSLLAKAITELRRPPKVFLSISAIGYYGSGGERVFDEADSQGAGFLAEVCAKWEAAARPANAHARVVHPRFGIVLGKAGGALKKLLPVFRCGFGGPVGSGEQYMSWIGLDDLLSAISFLLSEESLDGPVNIASPQSIQNMEFTAVLAKVLHRPAFLPVPAFALRSLLGQMADETLLASTRANPAKLLKAGFQFKFNDLAHFLHRECA